jgi:uncharacterized protein
MTHNRSPNTARLERIHIFPVKSLSAVALTASAVCSNGALQNDRRWALVDGDGKFVNAKRTARIHLLDAHFAPDLSTVTLLTGPAAETFALADDRTELGQYLTAFFGFAVRVIERPEGGFPDDTEAPGPTLISTATLETVAGWFPGLTLENARRRFRTNLEFSASEPFWEDRLFAADNTGVRFRLGEVVLAGTNPCQRCVVPTRDPTTGAIYPRFTPEFAARREQTLPAWAEASRFNHYYRLAINTRGVDCPSSARIRVGDEIALINDD